VDEDARAPLEQCSSAPRARLVIEAGRRHRSGGPPAAAAAGIRTALDQATTSSIKVRKAPGSAPRAGTTSTRE